MSLHAHFDLMASYNRWMNEKLYRAAAELSTAELLADKGAFFGSLFATLNHLCVADQIWLQRFAQHSTHFAALAPIDAWPKPAALDQLLFENLADLYARRSKLDQIIIDWMATVSEEDLQQPLTYTNTRGIESKRRFSFLLMHFFNHQAHHRGQATTLLSQAGLDVDTTDLLVIIPQEA